MGEIAMLDEVRNKCGYTKKEVFERRRESYRRYRNRHREEFRKRWMDREIKRREIMKKTGMVSEKNKARDLLRRSVKYGKVTKPDKCCLCKKKFPINKIHGHHQDHSKPFEVLWVCISCHSWIHTKPYPLMSEVKKALEERK